MNTQLKFKSRKVNITPDFACRLTGMTIDQTSSDVYHKLEANVMVFRSENNDVFIISVDTLFISRELKLSITEMIIGCFGEVEEKNIILLSTHTHYAPSLEERRIKLGSKDHKYYTFLLTILAKLFKELTTVEFQEVHLKIAEGKSGNLTCSRRRKARMIRDYFNPIITLEPNPKGYKNEEFKILNVLSAQNDELLGILWSYPCHPTNFPDRTLITSEFPGLVRDAVRVSNDSDLSIVYLPGMAGDVRAYPPKRTSINKFLRRIFNLSFRLSDYRFKSVDEYLNWGNSVVQRFSLINESQQELKTQDVKLGTSILKTSVSTLGVTTEGISDLIYRKFFIGDEFAIYTISAEPVSYYSELFESCAKEKFAMYTGYSDEVFGYLPTNTQIQEGGYESNGFFDAFLVEGDFISEVEQLVKSDLNKLL